MKFFPHVDLFVTRMFPPWNIEFLKNMTFSDLFVEYE